MFGLVEMPQNFSLLKWNDDLEFAFPQFQQISTAKQAVHTTLRVFQRAFSGNEELPQNL